MKVFLKILMWVGIIAVVVFVVLVLAVQISGNFHGPFFGIPALIDYLIERYREGNGSWLLQPPWPFLS